VVKEIDKILIAPYITEKATALSKVDQYVFKVHSKANKAEIKKAIEDFYKVNVLDVKIIKVPKKQRRFGKILGYRSGFKKAIVKIKKGQKIEIISK